VPSRRLAACLGPPIASPSLLKIDASRAAIADTPALYEATEDSTDLAPLPRVLRRWGDKAADRRAKRMQRYETWPPRVASCEPHPNPCAKLGA
jgi:hypothetical protein